MSAVIEFRLLGPVEVRVNGDRIDLGHPRQRCLLALLILEVNRIAPTARLVELMWGGDPPVSARNIIAGYASHLRKTLPAVDGAGREIGLRSAQGGYALYAPANAVDLHRFRQLRTEARGTPNHERAAAALREGVRLWRGAALADVTGAGIEGLRHSLEEERLATLYEHHDAELRCNRHKDVLPELQLLADQRPLDEAAARRLMIAQYRCGDLPGALATYDRMERLLGEQLGTRPTAELRLLRDRITDRDQTLLAGGVAESRAAWRPAQLPHDVPVLVGRDEELAAIDGARLGSPLGGTGVFVVSGMPGAGKTALAVRWAHQAAHRFPDGQLYVNLRGHDPFQPPLEPAEGLAQCLRALGVPAAKVPPGLDERIGLYRSLLTGRRVLVVLDDAADADQVRPLLPSDRGCAALVTSRRRLQSLLAREGARQVRLGPLDPAAAATLLSGFLGTARVAAEPDAATRLARLCGALPLALVEVGSRLAGDPGLLLSRVTPEPADDAVRAAFDLSYRTLSPLARRFFHCLGLLPGGEVTPAAAAALFDCDVESAGRLLDELWLRALVDESAPRRYRMHDLVRRYAAEQARARESPTYRQAATRRILHKRL